MTWMKLEAITPSDLSWPQEQIPCALKPVMYLECSKSQRERGGHNRSYGVCMGGRSVYGVCMGGRSSHCSMGTDEHHYRGCINSECAFLNSQMW